jgi:DNA-binding NtrC family response regulator
MIRLGIHKDRVVYHCIDCEKNQTEEPDIVVLPVQGIDLDAFLESIENDLIHQALDQSHGNKSLAAQLLGLNRTTLLERLRKKGLLVSRRKIPLHESERDGYQQAQID